MWPYIDLFVFFCLQQTHANGGKDVDEQHLKQEEVANQKEMNQPYIAGYTSRRANYITAYRTRQDGEESYLAKYGTKEDLEDSGMKNKKQVSLCSSIRTITLHFRSLHLQYVDLNLAEILAMWPLIFEFSFI